jgi:hypothetical protein
MVAEVVNRKTIVTPSERYSRARSYGLVIAVYVLATVVTNAHFMADTVDYVDSIVAFIGGRNYDFWEFGHLFWRPLGWLVFICCKPLTSLLVGPNVRTNVTLVLVAINWVSGLISVCALCGILQRVYDRFWVIFLVTAAFIFSHGFLNFSQTGCSYIPGLSLLLLGLYVLARSESSTDRVLFAPVIAGIAFGGAVCLWFPYILALPAAVSSPLFLFGFDRRRWRSVITTSLATGLVLALGYAIVVIGVLGIRSFEGFKVWMTAASHDTDIKGVTRMVFGFARSFIYMGNDGMLFKRYLIGDPFNPVSLFDLVRLSLWKLALFYLFLAAVTINLIRSSQGRRMLAFLVLNAAPVILFAISFDGGAIERYLPLYPAIFVALTVSLCSRPSWALARYVALAFVAAMVIANSLGMAKPRLDRQQEATATRIREVLPRLKADSRILAVTWQDELVNFSRSFPFHPLNQAGNLRIGALVTPGTTFAADWRKGFARQAFETWSRGGEMWVSKRVLSQRPRADWNWAEGDEKRVSWPDFYEFFSHIESGEAAGGEDGFILISPTEKNRQFLGQQLLGDPGRSASLKILKRRSIKKQIA